MTHTPIICLGHELLPGDFILSRIRLDSVIPITIPSCIGMVISVIINENCADYLDPVEVNVLLTEGGIMLTYYNFPSVIEHSVLRYV